MKKYISAAGALSAIILAALMFCSEHGEYPYYMIAKEMGYGDVSETPQEIVEIYIPQKFNKVYQRYNELLKTEGYDLSPYRGKRCLRYTYPIPSLNARANILVYNGKVIGGDISGITLDGIMIPIKRGDYSATGQIYS